MGRSAAAAAAFGRGRLSELRWLIWPGAPKQVAVLVQQQCPKVQLNPMPAAVSRAVARATPAAAVGAPWAGGRVQAAAAAGGAAGPALARPGAAAAAAAQQGVVAAGRLARAGPPSLSKCGVSSQLAGQDGSPQPCAWDPLDPMCALDQPLVSMVGSAAWEGLGDGCNSATPQARPMRSLAERFR